MKDENCSEAGIPKTKKKETGVVKMAIRLSRE
jgi:hypothetical protein